MATDERTTAMDALIADSADMIDAPAMGEVERVARAMAEAQDMIWDRLDSFGIDFWTNLATAALSAMSPAGGPCVVCGIANPNHHVHLAPFNEEYHEYQPPVSPAGEVEKIVAWLRADADLTEAEAVKIVKNSGGDPRKNALAWDMLVILKRGLATAIEAGEHKP